METEFNELDFHTWKLSSMNSIFMSHPMSHPPDGHVGTELEIEPTRLDFRKWSPALHVLPWVPTGNLFPLCPSHYISNIEHYSLYTFSSSQFSSSQHSILSECTLHSSLHYSQIEHSLHYTHLTQHFRYTIFYLLVFFLLRKI